MCAVAAMLAVSKLSLNGTDGKLITYASWIEFDTANKLANTLISVLHKKNDIWYRMQCRPQ